MDALNANAIKSIMNINWSIMEVFIGILVFTIISFISSYVTTGVMGLLIVLNLSTYLWTFTELLIIVSATSLLFNKMKKPESKFYIYLSLFFVYIVSLLAGSIIISYIHLLIFGIVALYDYLFKWVVKIVNEGIVPRSKRHLFQKF